MEYRLQNLIFVETDDMRAHWGLYCQKNMLVLDQSQNRYLAGAGKTYDFVTYLNSFSLAKWKKYTGIEKVKLRLTISGKFQINLIGCYKESGGCGPLQGQICQAEQPMEFEFCFQDTNATIVGFELVTAEDCYLYGGYYFVEVEEKQLRPIELSIATVTFRKENFITSNLALLKKDILDSQEELAKHLRIHVIDNGRTLPSGELSRENIVVHPNDNVGGSGGYARGMIEALKDSVKPTNVLLLDDDIIVLPESIKRLYYLLRLLKPEYQNYFISGAMLYYEERNVQHEDVGRISADGSYGPVKNKKYLQNWKDMLENEREIPHEKNQYAGWWFCCIPTTIVRLDNLPLPLFIRGDDVEYSIRNQAKFITMNGICVWHMGFVQKFNAAMELYQVHRNSLMIQAFSGVAKEINFIARIKKLFRRELLRFNYDSAELLLDSIEDYLKGYPFLMEPNGERIMKEKAAKNEQLIPLSEYPGIKVNVDEVYEKTERNWIEKFLFKLTYNGHFVPNICLKKAPSVIAYDWFYSPKKYYMRKNLLAVNPNTKTAHMRTINRRRFMKLNWRYYKLMRKWEKNHNYIEQEYQKNRDYLISYDFWKRYCKLE
ncbi:MAG: glycosyltransferase family 2 protein [Lachnospiraceae bacterium]